MLERDWISNCKRLILVVDLAKSKVVIGFEKIAEKEEIANNSCIKKNLTLWTALTLQFLIKIFKPNIF